MANPDNRKNNVERLTKMVENTKENIEAAEETMDNEDLSSTDRQAIEEKNHRRNESIESFKAEITDEKNDRENGRV